MTPLINYVTVERRRLLYGPYYFTLCALNAVYSFQKSFSSQTAGPPSGLPSWPWDSDKLLALIGSCFYFFPFNFMFWFRASLSVSRIRQYTWVVNNSSSYTGSKDGTMTCHIRNKRQSCASGTGFPRTDAQSLPGRRSV